MVGNRCFLDYPTSEEIDHINSQIDIVIEMIAVVEEALKYYLNLLEEFTLLLP